MNDTSSDKVRNLESRVTEAGEAVGERVRSATAVAAAATGQAERIVQDATAATVAAAGQAKKCSAMRAMRRSKRGRKQAK